MTKPLIIRGERTSGIIQSLLSAMIFFSPNFLLFFQKAQEDFLSIFLIYNFVIIFMLVSSIANIKFNGGAK